MKTLLVSVGIVFGLALAALAETISLTASADTTLFENFPDHNLGAAPLAAGTTAHGFFSRALIKFDLANRVPADAIITSARVRLNVVRIPMGPQASTFLLHRVLRDWGEGSQVGNIGLPASDGEATWNNRFHASTPWENPGGAPDVDFASTASSSSAVFDIGTNLFDTSTAMVADVQNWLANPGQNFGWILISGSEETWSTARRFGSKEDPNNPPILEIEFAPSFQIDNPRLAGATFRFSFKVEPLFTYTVESRQSLSSGSWSVLTNFTETTSSYDAAISDPVRPPSGFYRVRKAPCNCQ